MKHLLLKFILLVALFFGVWFALQQVPWVRVLRIQQFTSEKQKQVGDLILKAIKIDKQEVKNDSLSGNLELIKNRICLSNGIDTSSVHIFVLKSSEVNAFVLPGNNMIIYSALISECDNAEMLAGVMAHELAHIEGGHVAKKLIKEVGISALLMLSGNGQHSGIVTKIIKTITSTGFDREQEREADRKAVQFMETAGIDPKPLALFFDKLQSKQTEIPEAFQWMSTHPASEERSKNIIAQANGKTEYRPLIDQRNWEKILEELP